MTAHNTVVLFDVENLLGDPAGWKQAAMRLSFGDIMAQLRRDGSGLVGHFAVSRAYGNWGLSFMSTLRREMTENGIEPRQIFAYDGAAKKNAADIELVIDALDLAYSRPALSTFVLVTRDGGFSSLGRKLHELGKAVVVCADESCSKALRAVADAFVDLPAPDEGLLVIDRPADTRQLRGDDLGAEGDRLLDEAREAAVREVTALASADRSRVARDGLLLANVGNHFAQTVPTLPVARSAYPGLREFLQWALLDSPYCIVDVPSALEGARFRLGLRAGDHDGVVLGGYERRPPRVSDRVDLYRLLASQGKPPLRLPAPQASAQVVRAIAKSGIRDEEISSVINRIADTLVGSVSTTDVKNAVLVLAQSAAMTGDRPSAPISDRRYTLSRKAATYPALRAALLDVVRDKLARWVEVDEEALNGLVTA